jgi:hypothetical protein
LLELRGQNRLVGCDAGAEDRGGYGSVHVWREDDGDAGVDDAIFLEVAVAGEALHDHRAGGAVDVVVFAAFAVEAGVVGVDEADVVAFFEAARSSCAAERDDLADGFMADCCGLAAARV